MKIIELKNPITKTNSHNRVNSVEMTENRTSKPENRAMVFSQSEQQRKQTKQNRD